MEPAYKPGDRVVTFNWGKIKNGDVVVFKVLTSLRVESSRRGNLINRLLRFARNDNKMCWIKRVARLDENQVFVSGDNAKSSSKIGPVRLNQIIGKVILKY